VILTRWSYHGHMAADAAEARPRQAPTLALLRGHRDEILGLAARRGVSNIRVFGSVARGDATPDSDIDLLVDFEVGESGLDLIAFAEELEALLGFRVDVGTGVHRVVRSRVDKQSVPL
jgi:uncharacterized protein